MIKGKRVLAIIPARGGSKGVPRKNIYEVNGRPLIDYTFQTAIKSRYLDRVVVSSEDEEILSISEKCGAEVLRRPDNLAEDDTPSIDPVLHALEVFSNYEIVVLLQPTSPLRSVEDIDGALEEREERNAPVCVTLCEVKTSPLKAFERSSDGKIHRFVSQKVSSLRQDLPSFYQVNGAVYIADVTWLLKEKCFISEDTVGYLMPTERSLDIDTEFDLKLFEFLIQNQND